MGDLGDLIGGGRQVKRVRPRGGEAKLYDGIITSDPADATEKVLVQVPEFSLTHRFGPAAWAPRIVDDATFAIPSAGDRCLVEITPTKEAWVVMWWPDD